MLTSARLTYRQINADDEAESLVMAQSEEVMTYITGAALSLKEAKERFKHQFAVNRESQYLGFLRAESIETREFVGYVKMTPLTSKELEIGYAILPPFWGKGFATEMLKAMEVCASSLPDVDNLIGIAHSSNQASINVLLKNGFGFQKQGEKEDTHYIKNIR
ncbi:GNAT family N-acetyltransferase [uncultured Arcticibacterium sp.]|uniref:GNAT family N-acetyltransferase n=1 Tax=uncultured Arcticibacterium sp. TaxID=2173042 RepID=UPI0030F69B3E